MKLLYHWLAALVAAAGAIAVPAAPPHDGTDYNGFDISGALIPADAIERGGPPKDGIHRVFGAVWAL